MPAPPASAAGAASVTWQPGDVLLNLYEVKQVFESGGMGLVYRVHHRGWGVDLALKSPRAEYFQTPEHKGNFIREAETWVNLGLHPHTVSCYYVREIEGIPRVFAEYVESGSLSDWISTGRLYEGGPAKALERMLDMAIQFTWGLHYAHEQGLVHQDVKPGNVMLTAEGVAKVTDFGLARARAAAGEVNVGGTQRSILVSAGGMTPAYCSPEQANGEPLSRKTDLWSWALSVLEMFTGEVTWMAGQAAAEALEGYLENGVENPAIPKMPPGLAALLKKCFQRDLEARPRDMLAAGVELQEIYHETTRRTYPRQQPKAAAARADALNNRAVSLLDLGQVERAEALLGEALQVEAGHAEVTFNLGLLRWRQGKQTDTELLEALTAAAEAGGDARQWAYWRGLVHLERGDAERAAKELSTAAEGGLDETEVWKALGLARAVAGEWDVAETALHHAGERGASDRETALLQEAVQQNKSAGQFAPAAHGAEASRVLAEIASHRSHCARVFSGARQSLISVAMSADGRRLAAGDRHRSLWLWDLCSDGPPVACAGHLGPIPLVKFASSGNLVLSGGLDGSFREWDAVTGEGRAKHLVPSAALHCLAISPSGERALLVDENGGVQLLSFATGQAVRLSTARFYAALGVVFLANDQTVLTLGKANLLLWDLADEKLLANHPTQATSINTCVAVGADGRFALCGSDDGGLRLWSLDTGQCQRVFTGHRGPVTRVALLPGSKWFVSAGNDQTLRLWEMATGRCLCSLEGQEARVNALAVSADGRWVASAGEDQTVWLWRVSPAGLRAAPYLICRPKSAVEMIQEEVSFDGLISEAQEAVGRGEMERAYTRIRSAMTMPGFERAPRALGMLDELTRVGRRAGVRDLWERGGLEARGTRTVAVAGDTGLGLSGGTDGKLHVWNLRTGEEAEPLIAPYNSIARIACAPDGSRLAVAGPSTVVKVLDAGRGGLIASLEGHRAPITAMNYSPDRSLLITADQDGEIRVWHGRTDCLGVMKGGNFTVTQVVMSPDNRHLAAVDSSGRVTVWAVEQAVPVRRFLPKSGAILCVAFSPGGGYLLCGQRNGMIQLFQLSSGAAMKEWSSGNSPLLGLAFSPEGEFVLAGTQDGAVSLWHLPTSSPLGSLHAQIGVAGVLALAPDAGSAFLTAASNPDQLSVVVVDWELEFPQGAAVTGESDADAPAPVLRDDQAWAGLTAVELAARVWGRRLVRHGLVTALVTGVMTIVAVILFWLFLDTSRVAEAKAAALMEAINAVLPVHPNSTNLAASFYVGEEAEPEFVRRKRGHNVQFADYQKATTRILKTLEAGPENLPVLLKALKHRDRTLRRELLKLVSINTTAEVQLEVLVEALGDTDSSVFETAQSGFFRLRDRAIPVLTEAQRSGRTEQIRTSAGLVLHNYYAGGHPIQPKP